MIASNDQVYHIELLGQIIPSCRLEEFHSDHRSRLGEVKSGGCLHNVTIHMQKQKYMCFGRTCLHLQPPDDLLSFHKRFNIVCTR